MRSTITGQDIIIIGQQAWDVEIGSNCKNIALEFSKHNRVLYVNSPLDRRTLIRNGKDPKVQKRVRIQRGEESGLILIKSNLWNYYPDSTLESINWVTTPFIFNFLNKVNNKRFSKSILKAVDDLGFKDYLLFNDNEIFRGYFLKEFLKPKLTLYYSRDFMVGVDYWRKHGLKLEPQLIKKSDVCLCNSEYLADYCRQYNSNTFNVGQGCDFEDMQHIPDRKPDDMAALTGKLIGYVGSLNSSRLDINIIQHIAEKLPMHQIVLVGPEDDVFKSSRLHELSNVKFLGQKPVSELPWYIDSFDVCINPQLVNEITIGNYPRKIDEYLALGKPVVATKTKTMEFFADYTYLATTAEEYVSYIEEALQTDTATIQKKRKDFALEHTWENSVSKIYQAITLTSK